MLRLLLSPKSRGFSGTPKGDTFPTKGKALTLTAALLFPAKLLIGFYPRRRGTVFADGRTEYASAADAEYQINKERKQ